MLLQRTEHRTSTVSEIQRHLTKAVTLSALM